MGLITADEIACLGNSIGKSLVWMALRFTVPPLPTSSEEADADEDFSVGLLKHHPAILWELWPDAFSQALLALVFLVKLTDATLHNLYELKACSVCTSWIFNQDLLELKKKKQQKTQIILKC